MKKLLLSIFTIAAFAGTSFSQSVTIYEDGFTADISGTTFNYNLAEDAANHHMVDFIFNNLSGSTQSWVITRSNVVQPVDWSNYLCWGVDGGIGTCYPVNAAALWTCPAEPIPAAGAGRLTTYVSAPSGGSARYRYYVSTDGINYIDSIDILVTNTLAVKEIPLLSVSVAPNPATDYININASGVNNSTIRMVDVLGNVVLAETVIGTSKKIDIRKFRNGIYFLKVEAVGAKSVTRKIIIRH